jgi:protein involved in polysaccharide export with SLBB domain
MLHRFRYTCRAILVAVVAAIPMVAVSAQTSSPYATRSALRASLDSAERRADEKSLGAEARARYREEGLQLRRRLEQGDFGAGDRVVLAVDGQPTLSDTFTVRADGMLEVRELPPVSLKGVLRSELESTMSRHLAQYLRDVRVRATPLVRIAILGSVMRPGFLTLAPDVLLSDAIMLAGGPTGEADLQRTSVRRGSEVRVSEAIARVAIREGWTLDAMGVRAGDEIVVGKRKSTNWNQILTTSIMAIGAVATVVAITQ